LSAEDTTKLLAASENYIRFETVTGREIQWPKPLLRKVHKRVAVLLSRLQTPEFLHSAVTGRSYISNANKHTAEQPTVKVDLKKFFPSVRAAAVFHFFRDRMLCEADVAAVLTKLLTVDGHLPTGSSVSPVLSYFAYSDMFSEIEAIAARRGCTMTLYVDDMTFTGPGANCGLIHEVRQIARRYRQWAHKTQVFRARQPKVITGVAITKVGPKLPNRRQKAIADDLELLAKKLSDSERLAITRRAASRMHEAAQVDAAWRSRAIVAVAQLNSLERRIRTQAVDAKRLKNA
jgi:hypothetical protein